MTQIASTVNQEATAPTAGSSEHSLWLQYINRAYKEWSEGNDWEVLRKVYFPTVTGTSTASVPLPLDFKKMAGPVKLHLYSQPYQNEIPNVLREQIGLHAKEERFVSILGDFSSGFNLLFNPATLASGASLEVEYFAMPTSLASNAEIAAIPDSQFLVDRAVAYIFEARSDPRFQIVENKARERLLAMVENSNAAKYNSYENQSPIMSKEKRWGFRIGRN